jgi:antitoxin component of MazEF toxin-antitoxin module
MATSIQPDSNQQQDQTQQQDPSDTTNNTPQEEQNNPPAQPPVTNTPAPVSVEAVRNAYHGVLQETSQELQRTRAQLERLQNQQAQPPAHNPDDDVQLLTTNPRELIRQELRASLQPLQEQAQEFTRANVIANVKSSMGRDPRFNLLKIQGVSDQFDNLLAQTPNINLQVAQLLYNTAVGLHVQNGGSLNLEPVNPNPSPTVHNQTVPTPPPTRSAPPIVPVGGNQQRNQPKKQYNENELLIMRINNMTPEQYEREMNLAPQDVVKEPTNG